MNYLRLMRLGVLVDLKGGEMIVKVRTKSGLEGAVDIESWANPRTQVLDFVDNSGNSKPEYKDELEYVGIEES